MAENNDINFTDKNLDRLSDFLNRELENPAFASQIPDGAHIFHGSYNDATLTQGNLNLATKLLLGMMLGYVEEAPLMMVFEHKDGKHILLNLSETRQKKQAQAFIGRFQKQSQKTMAAKIKQFQSLKTVCSSARMSA
jgi:hypothetical protein